tara:strand:+ start:289 stop:441 length:153 start_codon:yes stop_codon:yes gene_type:complete
MNKRNKELLIQQIVLLRSAVGNTIDDSQNVVNINYNEIHQWLDDILEMIE